MDQLFDNRNNITDMITSHHRIDMQIVVVTLRNVYFNVQQDLGAMTSGKVLAAGATALSLQHVKNAAATCVANSTLRRVARHTLASRFLASQVIKLVFVQSYRYKLSLHVHLHIHMCKF